jgi:hypothetical protein
MGIKQIQSYSGSAEKVESPNDDLLNTFQVAHLLELQ